MTDLQRLRQLAGIMESAHPLSISDGMDDELPPTDMDGEMPMDDMEAGENSSNIPPEHGEDGGLDQAMIMDIKNLASQHGVQDIEAFMQDIQLLVAKT